MIDRMSAFVVPHDPAWKQAFDQESDFIRHALGEGTIVLHHIGSTAIPHILAKPIIDLLGIVSDLTLMDRHHDAMCGMGYEVMGAFGIEGRRYFRKFDASGQRTHHLHVFAHGSPHIERHLAFRDYLTANPAKAAEYSNLKMQIISDPAITWDAYANAKDPFITKTERMAVDWYRRNDPATDAR